MEIKLIKILSIIFLAFSTIIFAQDKSKLKIISLNDSIYTYSFKIKLSDEPIKVAEPTDVSIKDADLFVIKKNNFYGYMDKKGNIVIAPKFYYACNFSEGLAYADLGYTKGFIDKTGKLIIDLKSYTSDYFFNGMALINFNMMGTDDGGLNWYKYIDKNANEVFPGSYIYATPFKEGFAFVKTRQSLKLISKEKVIAEIPDDIIPYSFSEGFARFNKKISNNKKWGYIDTTGKIVIKPIYDNAYDFSEGMAVVSRADTSPALIRSLFGYINNHGKILIELKYDQATDFSNGLALVRKHFYCFGINKKGDTIFYLNNFLPGDGFLPLSKFSDGLARGRFWRTDKKIRGAFIDTTGKVVISINFNHAVNFKNGLSRIWLDDAYGEWSYIDKSGKIIFNPKIIPSSIIPDSVKNKPRQFGIQ